MGLGLVNQSTQRPGCKICVGPCQKLIIQEGYGQLNLQAVRAPALCPYPYSYPPYLFCRSHMHLSLRLLNDRIYHRLLKDRKSPRQCELIIGFCSLCRSGTWLKVQEGKGRRHRRLALKCYHQPQPPGKCIRTLRNNLLMEKFDSW